MIEDVRKKKMRIGREQWKKRIVLTMKASSI